MSDASTPRGGAFPGGLREAGRTIATSVTAVVLMSLLQAWFVLRIPPRPAAIVIPVLVGLAFGALVAAIRAARARERSMALRLAEAQQARYDAMARLAGGIGHDLNNVLTAAMCCADCLRDRAADARRDRCGGCAEALEDLDVSLERARDIGRQLVMLSRTEVADPELLDLRAIVEELVPVLRRLLGDATRLEVLAPDRAPVRASRTELEQVVLNLAANARDATAGGGTISIAVRREGAGVALAVRDTGAGMDGETCARMFEPFFTTKGTGKGTGLGLMVVDRVVRRAGGRIDVRTALGEGTEVTVSFPAAEAAAPRSTAAA